MMEQGSVAKNWSARRHVRRQFSTNYRKRHLGRDSVYNVLSVTFASLDRMRSRSCVVAHEPKEPVVGVGLEVRRERKKARVRPDAQGR